MNLELTDRVAIVGGASKGLGRACAQTATTVRATIAVDSNQSSRSPRSSTSCRQPKPAIISPRPHQSTRPALRR